MPGQPTLADQTPVRRKITEVYDAAVPERLGALRIGGGAATLEWQFRDGDGNPVDITSAAADSVRLRLTETTFDRAPVTFPATVADAVNGTVTVAVQPSEIGGPGIYRGSIAVVADPAADPLVALFSNPLLLVVERDLFSDAAVTGPPTIAEVRLHLRDSSPSEHRLIDTVTFDDAEIAASIARPVAYFDEDLPQISVRYTTQNFPFRFHWLEGTKANLFWIAAEYYRKNHLRYQAAGVAADDLDKSAEYERKAAELWQTYREWCHKTKVRINVDEAYGWVPSSYAYISNYRLRGWR